MLWLIYNASPFTSRFIDTRTVLLLLCRFGLIEWKYFGIVLLNGFVFKILVALTDNSVIYFIS